RQGSNIKDGIPHLHQSGHHIGCRYPPAARKLGKRRLYLKIVHNRAGYKLNILFLNDISP
ncbi:hypothetical protein, partial [Brucella sp. B13-0095]|uniref:hypothetical protein n=1 Tax=Brucella sp. B13-0095 TaxID=1867845 RepID=UPI001AECEA72